MLVLNWLGANPKEAMRAEKPWCIAHRGARNETPENTITALKRALTYPVDGIEFDVQLSADGTPVLYHDHTLRMVGGGNRRVREMTDAELAALDWGRWFHVDFTGEPLPTLSQALSLLPRCPQMLIEIKTHPGDHETNDARRLTETVINLVDGPDIRPMHSRIMVLSFDPAVLQMAHQKAPYLQYVLNYREKNLSGALDETGHLTAVDVRIDKLNQNLADKIRSQNLRLFTYTCNKSAQVDKALRYGVDAIISDRTEWLAGYLDGVFSKQG